MAPAGPTSTGRTPPALIQVRRRALPPANTKKHGKCFFFFGVILPLLALIFETSFHFCAQNFFDPFPGPAHVVLFALIPLSNLLTYLAGRKDMSDHYCFMSLVSGMAMGIGCLYTIMFLPLTANSCMLVLLFGFGLLGLAPLLSMPCTWLSGKTVCHLAQARSTYFNPHQLEHIGHLIVLVMVIAVELPSTLTRINLATATQISHLEPEFSPSTSGLPQIDAENLKKMAAIPPIEFNSTIFAPSPLLGPLNQKQQEAQKAINWLRQYGNQETLLRACYERSGKATDILGSLWESHHPIRVEDAREVFFRVTGKPFNTVPIPQGARATLKRSGAGDIGPNAGVSDEFDYDADIAGESVSGLARGLSLDQSKISGTLYHREKVAQLTWQMTLKNKSAFDREMRVKMLLPPHAVIYKAALIVDGREYDAEIMARQAARAYYQQAVKEHKDPLLVSTCGLDQVLIQCFPIQPGKESTLKIELAAPLFLTENKGGALTLPSLLDRNFLCEKNTEIALNQELDPNLEMSLGAKELANLNNTIFVAHTSEKEPSARREVGKRKLFLVIDGSKGMQEAFPEIAEALASSSANLNLEIAVLQDNPIKLYSGAASATNPAFLSALDYLREYKTKGGIDNCSGLDYYLKEAASPVNNNCEILWIHGDQPFPKPEKSTLNNYLLRGTYHAYSQPLLWDMPVSAGPNEVLAALTPDKAPGLARVPRTGLLKEDLKEFLANYLCANLNPKGQSEFAPYPNFPALSPSQRAAEDGQIPLNTSHAQLQASSSANNEAQELVKKLTVNERILQLLSEHTASSEALACTLASSEHLVSPISSAIVTKEIPHKELNAPPSRPLAIESLKGSFEDFLAKITGPSFLYGDNLQKMAARAPSTEIDYIQKEEEGRQLEKQETRRKIDMAPSYFDNRQENEKKGDFRSSIATNKELITGAPSSTPVPYKTAASPGAAPEVSPRQTLSESRANGTENSPSPVMQGATNGVITPQVSPNEVGQPADDAARQPGSTWDIRHNYFTRNPNAQSIFEAKAKGGELGKNLRMDTRDSESFGTTGSEQSAAKDKSLIDSFMGGVSGNLNSLSSAAQAPANGVNTAGSIRYSDETNRNALKDILASYIPSPFLILGAALLIILLALRRQKNKSTK